MSQFWYDELTAKNMAAEVKRLGGRVACLACPSLYRQMMARAHLGHAAGCCGSRRAQHSALKTTDRLAVGRTSPPTQVDCPEVDAQLFEFDRRFEQLEKFTFYDYNDPEDVPDYLHHEFDVRHAAAAQRRLRRLVSLRGTGWSYGDCPVLMRVVLCSAFSGCGCRPAVPC